MFSEPVVADAGRILQLDSFRLDDELLSIVIEQFNTVMDSTPPFMRGFLMNRLGSMFRILIGLGAVLRNGTTPGMSELGLEFSNDTSCGRSCTLLPYACLRFIVPDLWARIRRGIMVHTTSPSASNSRWREHGLGWMNFIENITSVAHFLNMVVFLHQGKYYTLTQRLTGNHMTRVNSNEGRAVSFEYLNQQLVWGELQNFVMFLLPLVTPGSPSASPFLISLGSKITSLVSGKGLLLRTGAAGFVANFCGSACNSPRASVGNFKSKHMMDNPEACAICSTDKILAAVETDCCGARMCYMCAQRHWQLTASPSCPRCGAAMSSSSQLAQVAEETEEIEQ